MMRTFPVAAVALLLAVASFFCLALAAPHGLDTSPCCFGHTSQKIPKRFVESHFNTSAKCSLPSVVFLLKNGRQACADPNAQWVKVLLRSLEKE